MDADLIVTVAIGVAGLFLLVLTGILIALLQPPEEATMLPDGDPDRLCYCDGCGCRHRQFNMEWKPSGAYRCWVCCLDYDKASTGRN